MHILLYTSAGCSFCVRAKELLDARGLAYEERSIVGDQALKARLAKLFGRKTMPYVMVRGEPLGGLAELEQLLKSPFAGE